MPGASPSPATPKIKMGAKFDLGPPKKADIYVEVQKKPRGGQTDAYSPISKVVVKHKLTLERDENPSGTEVAFELDYGVGPKQLPCRLFPGHAIPGSGDFYTLSVDVTYADGADNENRVETYDINKDSVADCVNFQPRDVLDR